MILVAGVFLGGAIAFPRTRGDDPGHPALVIQLENFSPHPRG